MPGYLLAAAFHKQAFASATQHQLLAFLQVAAFTNRTAVLPFARVGEPAFVGLPRPGFGGLDRYFDVAGLAARWPCLRAITAAFRREAPRARIVALQLGLPPGRAGSVVAAGCGRRSRPLVALGATFACASAALAASASATLGGRRGGAATRSSSRTGRKSSSASGTRPRRSSATRSRRAAGAGTRAPAATRARSRRSRRGGTREPTRSLRRRRCSESELSSAPTSAPRPASNTPRAWSARPELAAVARARATLRAHANAGREARERRDRPRETEPVGLRRRGRRVDVALHGAVRGGRAPSRRARPRADRSSCSPTPPRRTACRRTRAALASASGGGRGERPLAPCSRQRPRTAARSPPRTRLRRARDGADYHRSRAAARARRRTFPPRRSRRRPSAAARPSRRRRSGTFSAFLVGDGASRPPSAQFLSCPEIRDERPLPHSCREGGSPSRGGAQNHRPSRSRLAGRLDYNARLVYNVVCLRHRAVLVVGEAEPFFLSAI